MQIHVPLKLDARQRQSLKELQVTFAAACNAITPLVQQTRIWNRVALHHLVYKTLREKFPALGSQMACNVIYSVSRISRVLYQSPASPFNVIDKPDRPLPLLRFSENCPVYFDRHTLSLKRGELSMFTMEQRIHFQLQLGVEQEKAFHQQKLREIVLNQGPDEEFKLQFTFALPEDAAPSSGSQNPEVPQYILIEETH